MGYMSYNRVGRRCNGMRGFKLNSRRFSVQRLRVRFLYLVRIFSRSWKSSYGHAIRVLKKKFNDRSSSKHKDSETYMNGNCSSTSRNLVRKQADYAMYGKSSSKSDFRLKSYGRSRSNSFYAEAIADCLDFIKRNSLSMEEKPVLITHES